MNVGVLTGGGDCPGLNPVIRAVVRTSIHEGYKVTGIHNGWKGLVENDTAPLDMASVSGIIHRGGTILGTSRTNIFKEKGLLDKVRANWKDTKAGFRSGDGRVPRLDRHNSSECPDGGKWK